MRICQLAILGAVLSSTSAFGTTLIGTGAHNCSEYLSDVRYDLERDLAWTQWALGFISGTVTSMPKGKREFDVSALHPEMMKSFLSTYCTKKPESEFLEAVDQLLFSLPTKARD
jgi:hypothetical protein